MRRGKPTRGGLLPGSSVLGLCLSRCFFARPQFLSFSVFRGVTSVHAPGARPRPPAAAAPACGGPPPPVPGGGGGLRFVKTNGSRNSRLTFPATKRRPGCLTSVGARSPANDDQFQASACSMGNGVNGPGKKELSCDKTVMTSFRHYVTTAPDQPSPGGLPKPIFRWRSAPGNRQLI